MRRYSFKVFLPTYSVRRRGSLSEEEDFVHNHVEIDEFVDKIVIAI